MYVVFQDLLDVCVVVYLDDILIYSKDENSHRQHLRMVFDRLKKHQLYCKESKCELFLKKVDFLGHVISADGVAVEDSKIQAVSDWPVPSCLNEVQ